MASPRLRIIFNPQSGDVRKSPQQLLEILAQMQERSFESLVYLLQEGSDLAGRIQADLQQGIELFVAAGGDGTIDSVAACLANTPGVLGIVPAGTRNNIALSLGIPSDIPVAVDLLRQGQRIKMDLGLAECAGRQQYFMETCSIGLFSALFPAADDIQHGELNRIGDLLAALVASQPAKLQLKLDGEWDVECEGHAALVANLPFVGPNLPLAPPESINDGLLEVLLFADQNKIEVFTNMAQMTMLQGNDERIRHYQVHRLEMHTDPPMPVLADGFELGATPVTISIQKGALNMIAGVLRSKSAS
jgi:diacylglycerol kinase (ATP)